MQTLPESAYCGILYTPPFLFESSSLLFFIVPMTIMVFLYVRMGLKVRVWETCLSKYPQENTRLPVKLI